MKRLLMLIPHQCASGDTREGKIYDIIEDYLIVYRTCIDEVGEEDEEIEQYEYNDENLKKYLNFKQHRCVTINDESSQDSFEVYEDEERFIIFENNKELAHALIDRIEGLDDAIVNMSMLLNK